MKHSILFMSVFLSFSWIGCSSGDGSDPVEEDRSTYFEGQFQGIDSGTIYLVPARDALSFRHYVNPVDSFVIDSSGAYGGVVTNLPADFYQIRLNDRPGPMASFYVGDEDSVSIRFDENYQVIGESTVAGEIRYQNMVNRRFRRDRYPGFTFGSYGLPADSIRMLYDDIYSDQIAFLDSVKTEKLISDAYAAFARNEVEADRVENLLNHTYYYYYVNTGTFQIPPTDSMHPGLSEQVLTLDQQYYFGMNYGQAMSRYIEIKGFEAAAALDDSIASKQMLPARLQLIKEQFSGVGREFLLYQLSERFAFSLSEQGNDFFAKAAEIDAYFQEVRSDANCYEQFTHHLSQIQQLKPGMPAPSIELPDRDGNMVSLEDFRGSVVYLDFWGSWCGPCLQQIPDARALHERVESEGLDIVFLGISMESGDEQIAEWKRILDNEQVPGVHLLAEGQFGNSVPRSYVVSSAPTYVIIDQQGNIAYARAQRPAEAYKELVEVVGQAATDL